MQTAGACICCDSYVMPEHNSQAKTVVIDNGSFEIKAGLSGEPEPSVVFQNVISQKSEHCFVGDEIFEEELLELRYPIERGIVTNWDCMEKIWHHAFEKKLSIESKDHGVIITDEPWRTTKSYREMVARIMFEEFSIPSLCISDQHMLALFASGRITGTLVNVGYSTSHVVPVFEGYSFPHASKKLCLGGSRVTGLLGEMLGERGHTFNSLQEVEILRKIKERLCYVAPDELSQGPVGEYELPDGQILRLSEERFKCPEVFFKPENDQECGVPQTIIDSILLTDVDIRDELFRNICLSGGSAVLPGFRERIEREVKRMTVGHDVRVITASKNPAYAAWTGASILTSLSSFGNCCMSKAEYDEFGPSFVHRRFTS